ncbi:DUF4123 domain-containing protein [Entomomonas asaccharolytica]|uniref:DUF4123 domain-containing protein n=1 Tax=Entomomonas asaccharolytica TaxID=2785331 RepID=A0A974RWT4_9GAMM|nr:DUF4123 domain-containing protein [Entomomonas asaccharolytica]QQP85462.1 DUF4123 domain-containing protein [Entomomonas asaccharolytica]
MNRYILIDGVMRQSAINDLYSLNEPLQILPLYINTPFQANYDLGAILVATLANSTLINKIQATWYNSTTIIYSKEPLAVIAQHLSQLITIQDEIGITSLFRFADPLITWYWLNSYSHDQLTDILNPIQQWQVIKPIANYYTPQPLIWDKFINPQTEKKDLPINKLANPQLEALDKAYQFRLKEKLHKLIIQAYPTYFQQANDIQINQWLNNCLQQAKQQQIISEQSIAMFAILRCEYGDQFATEQQGDYQKWLADNPHYKPLPLEKNLAAFFAQRPLNIANTTTWSYNHD